MKYNIEGNLQFYEELYKEEEEEENENQKYCLITNEPLKENFITLECNHSFNYTPIFNDILNHKLTYNKLESTMLKNNQLRCPYCRNVQNKLLPHFEGIKKVFGVNCLDDKYAIYANSTPHLDGYVEGGKCNYYNDCNITYVKKMSLDDKTYCYCHMHLASQKYYKNEKMKLYENAKKLKLEKKEKELEKKKKLMEEKEKLKEEKKKLMEEKQKLNVEKKKLAEEKQKLKEEKQKEKEEKQKLKEEKQKLKEEKLKEKELKQKLKEEKLKEKELKKKLKEEKLKEKELKQNK